MGQILSTLWKGSKKGLGKLICGLSHVCSSLWNWMLGRGLSKKERKRRKKKSREFWCSLLHTVQSFVFGRPSRQGVQVHQMVTAMEGMEARLVDFLRTEMQTAREEMNSHMVVVDRKLDQQGEKMEEMNSHMAVVDQKLEQQGEKMEELQLMLTLSMDSIGQVQQDQVMMKKALNGTAPPHLVIPAREEPGILAARTREMRVQPAGRQEIPPAPDLRVLKFYSNNHSHIVCEHGKERFSKLTTFLKGKAMLDPVDIPGTTTQLTVTTKELRRLLFGILVRFRHMHSEGKTLEGRFSARNLLVPEKDLFVTPYTEVKLGSLDPDAFVFYTLEGGNKDFSKVAGIVRNVILAAYTNLPSELTQFLALMRHDPVANQDLICCHVCLMGPREKVSHFMWLYKRLLLLQKTEPTKYKNIIQKITDGIKDRRKNYGITDWRENVKKNKFVNKIFDFSEGGYDRNGRGLTRFYRNSVEHLTKNLLETNQQNIGKTEEKSEPKPAAEKSKTQPAVEESETQPAAADAEVAEMLEDYHIAYILVGVFPRFLGDLQQAFHDESELNRFSEEDASQTQKHTD